jgi:hypothetical protein
VEAWEICVDGAAQGNAEIEKGKETVVLFIPGCSY